MTTTVRSIAAMMAILAAGCGEAPPPVTPISIFPPPGAHQTARLACARHEARHWVHVELFERGRGVLVPAGIGIRDGVRDGAYVTGGRCRLPLFTEEPTGLVGVARDGLTLGDLYTVWGRRIGAATVHVDGHRWTGSPGAVPLRRHAQIVVQTGNPTIVPHGQYRFPPRH
jgi:hypothetical protein